MEKALYFIHLLDFNVLDSKRVPFECLKPVHKEKASNAVFLFIPN